MEAEEKAGRQEHLSKTVRLILDKCRTIAGEGRLVNMSVLKIVCPNHSNRDYVRALDVFKVIWRKQRFRSRRMFSTNSTESSEGSGTGWLTKAKNGSPF